MLNNIPALLISSEDKTENDLSYLSFGSQGASFSTGSKRTLVNLKNSLPYQRLSCLDGWEGQSFLICQSD